MDGNPVSLTSLQPGGMLTVFPEDQVGAERAQTVLIRVKEQLLQLPQERAGWAPRGYVAYSRVCTHAGCPVGEFQTEQSILLCPCHQSTFDVLRGAVPTSGPAARPLPQLPLYADADGTLRAGGGFTAPPGPGFWGMP
jgi:ubiquinol-cytochrome c reductase iron-sulfur subunit